MMLVGVRDPLRQRGEIIRAADEISGGAVEPVGRVGGVAARENRGAVLHGNPDYLAAFAGGLEFVTNGGLEQAPRRSTGAAASQELGLGIGDAGDHRAPVVRSHHSLPMIPVMAAVAPVRNVEWPTAVTVG